MNWRHLLILPPLCAAAIGCGTGRATEGSEDGPAAAIAPVAVGTPLGEMLDMLQAAVDTALSGGLNEEEVNARLARAEALTDRLLDSRIPFEWLSNEQYSLNARLRQIQAMADRVQAQIRSRTARTAMLADAALLRDDVARLRAEITEGGGAAPPPLSELLERADSTRRLARLPADTLR